MGSHWYLYNRKCPYCGKVVNEIIFAENSYYKSDMSKDCDRSIKVRMEFTFSKLEEKE